jgi:hypothetical protein
LRWVSEIGLPTLFVTVLWAHRRSRKALGALSRDRTLGSVKHVLGMFFVPMLLLWAMGYVSPQFYIFLGVLVAIPLVVKEDRARAEYARFTAASR